MQEILHLFVHDSKEPLLFHTGFYLFIFSLFMIAYAFVYHKNKMRNTFIILFGLYFYYKASGLFVFLLLFTISSDYVFSILMTKEKRPKLKKLYLLTGILFSLSFLMYFKYSNFFLENIGNLTHSKFDALTLILPIGISFYTFQSISYLVDIYYGKFKAPSFSDYLMYMSFFPHLVAGPIVRARDFLPQLKKETSLKKENINEAFYLISKGLIKKAIIADFIAQYSDIVFSQPDGFSGSEHLMATLCYTLQIFCDFSGYTDMAIGVALLLGFRLCVNFDSPYKSQNITVFWRRWHISLSSWLRDYIYIPMGGNRKGANMQALFLTLTMLIGGFWHGASWKFVFWGGAHGILLMIHKLFKRYFPNKEVAKSFNIVAWALTFACVALLWIPFRAATMHDAWFMYTKIFSDQSFSKITALYQVNKLLFLFIILGFGLTALPAIWKDSLKAKYYKLDFYMKVLILIGIIQIILQTRSATVQPFIYFQF